MAQVFVSYARRDGSALARRLVDDLQAAGHSPWLDRSEIQGGEAWSHDIEQAIDDCAALIAVLTAGSYESRVCRGEQLRALRKGKRILPVLARAGTDLPVYLEAAHFLDFSDAAAYAGRLEELLRTLAGGGGVGWDELPARVRQRLEQDASLGSEMPRALEGASDWDDLLQRAGAQRQAWLDALAGRGSAAGIYEPDLYLNRPTEEAVLQRLGEGAATALVLLGESGWGKTNLLAHWARLRVEAGDAAFVWAGERLDAAGFDGALARDLGCNDGAALARAWPRLAAMTQAAGRRLWLLIDGVNDAHGSGDAARALLLAADALVSRLPEGSIKVVLSCTPATWQRLDRAEPLRLAWRRYQRGPDDADVLTLDRFTPAQAHAAWERWRARLAMTTTMADLPPDYVERLREPVLLRLLAESLHARPMSPQPMSSQSLDFDALVFQRYFEQRVRRREDQAFVDDLAAEMLAQRSAALPLQSLLEHPRLGPALDGAGPGGGESPLARLLDDAVLSEMRGNLFEDDRLRFTYPQIGAYALVRVTLRRAGVPLLQAACELAAAADALPLAWEAALTLLALRGDAAILAALADDADPERRQLALEALVRSHGAQPARTHETLAAWLDSGSPAQQRTSLRAAFLIGPPARDLLVRGALSNSPDLRLAVRDTLYLLWQGVAQGSGETRSQALYYVWRHAPDVTRTLMQELIARLRWMHPKEAARILGFVLDLTITIYINHCERSDVVEQTASLFRELTVERLHLDQIALGAAFERVVFRVVSAIFADRLLQWMLLEPDADVAAFFARPPEERAPIAQAAPWLDPASTPDLGALRAMLASEMPVQRGVATLVLAVHATADFDRAAPWFDELFEALDARGRSWLLAGLAVLLPGTPPAWLQRLVTMTRRAGDPLPPLLSFFDGCHVPLALAAAKAGAPMAPVDEALAQADTRPEAALRALDALGIVGFYHPRPVLAQLRPHLAALLAMPATADALTQALATIRTLHFDRVDTLLAQAEAPEPLRRAVIAAADPARVQQFMRLLGYYNNAVHFCVHYPRMRRGLAARALHLLATATSAREFITGYATQAIAMAREANFDLRQWTQPDADGADP